MFDWGGRRGHDRAEDPHLDEAAKTEAADQAKSEHMSALLVAHHHGSPVQMSAEAELEPEVDIAAAADHGTAGATTPLPHGERIQQAFGRHDISRIRAHNDGAAREATRAMGASAFARGTDVVFDGSPDLHTAAHEAAHVVQQRAGVHLAGGVGQQGDAFEQHADEVADLVVRGASAEAALDRMAGSGKGEGAEARSDAPVQMNRTNPQGSSVGGGQGTWKRGVIPGRWQSATPRGASVEVAAADLEQHLSGSGGFLTMANVQAYTQGKPTVFGAISLQAVLSWGLTRARFWADVGGLIVATKAAYLANLAGKIEKQVAAGPLELGAFRTDFTKSMIDVAHGGPPPLSATEMIAVVLGRGNVKQHGSHLVPAGWSNAQLATQDRLRARAGGQHAQANETDSQGQRRFDQTDQGGGWAVLGMLTEEHHHDQSAKVTYYDDVQREQVVLTLQNGQFVDAKGKIKNGPDYTNKSDGEILNSNPRAATVRYEELTGQFPSGQMDTGVIKKIADEFRSSARLIYVMDAAGRFFAGEGLVNVIHHSTFLGAGAVAAAGELSLSSGRPTMISNESGHYQPGPAYIWQAVLNMKLQGVDVASLNVELNGVKAALTGAQLLSLFSPTVAETDPRYLSFDRVAATAAINARLGSKP